MLDSTTSSDSELEDFVRTKFYCPYAFAAGTGN